jgi:hypothetical protein
MAKERRFLIRSERGQVSIMLGMMMMTFILFFAFVINTGMLVNAKINLQNAVDLATYSGAATQARLLNQISFLNYDMRRQWKKFVFRYYLMGTLSYDSSPPNGPSGGGQHAWKPANGKDIDYQVPVVCVIFSAADNTCHQVDLQPIVIPNATGLDSINDTLRGQLQALETIRQKACVRTGQINKELATIWAFNTDPTLTTVKAEVAANAGNSDAVIAALGVIAEMGSGLGIIPRELIHSARVKALASYVNDPPQVGFTQDKMQTLTNGPDPAAHERTINAFTSAIQTLGNHIFDDTTSITYDELMPPIMLKLNPIEVAKFDIYYFFTTDPTGGDVNPGTTSTPCMGTVLPLTITAPTPVGFKKDPTVLTYYAARLTAKANIMFSPFGALTLKAYSAAMPFGSRIGPQVDESAFIWDGASVGSRAVDGVQLNIQTPAGRIPNIGIMPGENAPGQGKGWDTDSALAAGYQAFSKNGGGGGGTNPPVIGGDAMEHAYQMVMGPNPIEVGRYNILIDQDDEFMKYFDAPAPGVCAGGGCYKFWAPIFTPTQIAQQGGAGDVASLLSGALDGLQDKSRNSDTSNIAAGENFLKKAITAGMTTYVQQLKNNLGGEDGETFNIASLRNPTIVVENNKPSPINLGGGMSADPTTLKTSFSDVKDSSLKALGRVGYSVKFVSFDSLINGKIKADDNTAFTNTPIFPDTGFGDAQVIRH